MTGYAGIVLTDICFLLLLTSNELTRKGHLYNNSVNLDICGQHLFVTIFPKARQVAVCLCRVTNLVWLTRMRPLGCL